MRRLITLLLLAVTVFAVGTKAQTGTTCNAGFNFTVAGNTVNFTPLVPGDSLFTLHNWVFGDGSPSSNLVFPSHTYATGGTYNVKHIIRRITPNGAPVCADTVVRAVTISNTVPCNLQANFTWVRDSILTNTFYFGNLTVNLQPTDSVFWNFGDGTSSTAVNPVHVYTQPGTYNVCLRVKRMVPAGVPPCVSEICRVVVVQPQVQPCNLVANFVWRPDSTQANKIIFTNTSTGFQPGDSIRWTFGDGTSAFDLNPVHIYQQPGTYTVCLRIKRFTPPGAAPCVSEICKVVIVQPQVQPCNLVANFVWRPDSTQANKIIFTNTSTGFQPGDSIRWTFGDGTSSFDLNPIKVYQQPGTYTVCLRIKRNGNSATTPPCVSEICKVVIVQPQVQPCNLQANFIWRADSLNPRKLFFTNTTVNFLPTDSIRWTFGDGTSSFAANPEHIYQQPGTYTVCLRVKRITAAGTPPCVSETCRQIVIANPCVVTANFTWRPDSLNNKKIFFTNLSTNASATAQWSFGDGTSSTAWSPVHEYAQPGNYIVCLRVQTGPNCVAYKCDTITVVNSMPPCAGLANFTAVRSTTNSQAYTFTPAFQNPAYQYTWSFGDGTGSQQMVANHTYQQPGVYTVCLTVFKNNTCVTTSCKVITVISQLNCNNINVNFVYQRDAFMPNKVYFYAISNFPLLQQRWTITKMPATASSPTVTLFQSNPVYVFSDTGLYRVCLRTVTMGGCVKETCQIIHIAQVVQPCNLFAYPNPAQNSVNVNVLLPQAQTINAYVYNAQNILVRQKVQAGVTGNNVVNINLVGLAPGFYTIKLVYGNKTCYARFQKI
jgi:PKD repeat protein